MKASLNIKYLCILQSINKNLTLEIKEKNDNLSQYTMTSKNDYDKQL
jgi:hypothetical protein